MPGTCEWLGLRLGPVNGRDYVTDLRMVGIMPGTCESAVCIKIESQASHVPRLRSSRQMAR